MEVAPAGPLTLTTRERGPKFEDLLWHSFGGISKSRRSRGLRIRLLWPHRAPRPIWGFPAVRTAGLCVALAAAAVCVQAGRRRRRWRRRRRRWRRRWWWWGQGGSCSCCWPAAALAAAGICGSAVPPLLACRCCCCWPATAAAAGLPLLQSESRTASCASSRTFQ